MIPSYFVPLDGIPLNSNGKVDRKALPHPEITISSQYVAPENETEENLVDIWAEVLAIEKEKVSVETGFFDLGGNSLSLIKMKETVKQIFNKDLAVAKLFQLPTIRSLAAFIQEEEINFRAAEEILEESVNSMDEALKLFGEDYE